MNPEELQDAKEKIDRMYNALMGDELGNRGIVKRIESLESEALASKQFRQKMVAGFSLIVIMGSIIAWVGDKVFELFKHK